MRKTIANQICASRILFLDLSNKLIIVGITYFNYYKSSLLLSIVIKYDFYQFNKEF